MGKVPRWFMLRYYLAAMLLATFLGAALRNMLEVFSPRCTVRDGVTIMKPLGQCMQETWSSALQWPPEPHTRLGIIAAACAALIMCVAMRITAKNSFTKGIGPFRVRQRVRSVLWLVLFAGVITAGFSFAPFALLYA